MVTIRELREWIASLSRRVEELEATAFQLVDDEDVILVSLVNEEAHRPKKRKQWK